MEIIPDEILDNIIELLENCRGVEQRKDYHPEGDVLNHSLQCFHIAVKESTDIDLVLAALLHDIGKAVEKYGHDDVSTILLEGLVSVKTLWLISQHMRVCAFIEGDMKRLGKIRELIDHPWLPDLIHLVRIDKMGRNPNRKTELSKEILQKGLERVVNNHFRESREHAQTTE